MRDARRDPDFTGRIFLGVSLLVVAGACARSRSAPGTIVVSRTHDIQGLDPHTAGQVLETQVVLSNLYEGLVAIDPDASLVPSLPSHFP